VEVAQDAEADQQIAVQPAQQGVDALGGGDLLMSRVVPDEGGPRDHHGEIGGDEQLPPGAAEYAERGPTGGQQQEVGRDLDGVVAGPSAQQPACFTSRDSRA